MPQLLRAPLMTALSELQAIESSAADLVTKFGDDDAAVMPDLKVPTH